MTWWQIILLVSIVLFGALMALSMILTHREKMADKKEG